MAALVDWARTLAVTLVFAGVADMLCPEGPLKREARLGVGLVVLAMLLSPLLALAPAALASEAGELWRAVAAGPPSAAPGLPRAGPAGAPGRPSPPGTLEVTPSPGGGPSEFEAAWREVYLAMLDARLAALAETVTGVRRAAVSAQLSGSGPGWGRIARLSVAIAGDPAAAPAVKELLAREAGLPPDEVDVRTEAAPSR